MKNLVPDQPYDLTVELARLRGLRDQVIPQDVVAHMDRATAELITSRAADRAVKLGSRAPDFTLPDAFGKEISPAATEPRVSSDGLP